jgi:thiamine transport system ATP-binding protein
MLELRAVTLRYGTATALDAIDLSVASGQTLAVMGPSGSGKTSLLRVVAGLEPPDAGTVRWDGNDVTETPPHERGFGLMFQDYALFPHKTVAGNVAFGLRMQGRSNEQTADRVAAALDLVGLTGYDARSVGTLSGGEQQRVALARTLAPAPKLVMLDEPIGSLDRTLRERLLVEMRRIFDQIDAGVLYVTHDRLEAFAVADQVAVMQSGRIVRTGNAYELWNDPRSAFTARFLGLENVFEASIDDGMVDTGWVRLPLPRDETGPVQGIAIAPNRLHLGSTTGIEGTVAAVRFGGLGYRVTVRIADGPMLVVDSPTGAPIGADVTVSIDADAVALLGS